MRLWTSPFGWRTRVVMRDRRYIVSHSARALARFVREPGSRSGLASSSFAQHVLSLLLGLAPVITLTLAGVVLFWAWRVWGRRRLAAGGCWFALRLGEEVSRAALETLMRTLAGGLRRPWFGAAPWVALSLSCEEDRAACGLFVSCGQSAVQVDVVEAND